MAKNHIQQLLFSDTDVDYINYVIHFPFNSNADRARGGRQISFITNVAANILKENPSFKELSEIVGDVTVKGINRGTGTEFCTGMAVYYAYLYVSCAYTSDSDIFYSNYARDVALMVSDYVTKDNRELGASLTTFNQDLGSFWKRSKDYAWDEKRLKHELNPAIMLVSKNSSTGRINFVGVDGMNMLRSKGPESASVFGKISRFKCTHTDEYGADDTHIDPVTGARICNICELQVPDEETKVDMSQFWHSVNYINMTWSLLKDHGCIPFERMGELARGMMIMNGIGTLVKPDMTMSPNFFNYTPPVKPTATSPQTGSTGSTLSHRPIADFVEFLKTGKLVPALDSSSKLTEKDLTKSFVNVLLNDLIRIYGTNVNPDTVYTFHCLSLTQRTKDLLYNAASQRMANSSKPDLDKLLTEIRSEL